ncbi:MAG: type VI secretion system tube protein Hcp [SAR324 cluster bacterium]|nr:type VI secretion system tube protein Hcp [SAR324 cluster bacterium]
MAVTVYLTITGEEDVAAGANSEDSVGALGIASHEDEIQILGVEENYYLPTDPETGQQSGAPISEGLTVLKYVDQSSPLLFQAMVQGEVFEEAELTYLWINPSGEEEEYFSKSMEKVTVTDIRPYIPNTLVSENEGYTHMEKVTFRYIKTVWEHAIAETIGIFNVGIFQSEE